MTKYKIGDKFRAKGCREYGLFDLTNIVTENNKVFYILEGLKHEHKYKVSEQNIDELYYREN